MNLLGLLTSLLGNSDITQMLSGNTKMSGDAVSSLLKRALPLLLKRLTSNASTEDGARSLANALSQHTSTASMLDQLRDADTEDGAKIIGHILGDHAETDIGELAQQVGVSNEQVSGLLSSIAPSLLSNLSSAFTNGLPEAEAPEQKEGEGLLGFVGKLFGKEEEDTSGFDGTTLLSALSALKND